MKKAGVQRFSGSFPQYFIVYKCTKTVLIDKHRITKDIAYVTLHVGLGTFRPVKAENILEHHMHSEYYQISKEAADKLNRGFAFFPGFAKVSQTSASLRFKSSNSTEAMVDSLIPIRSIFAKEKVHFQTAELGKVDLGGGGTIAYILALYGMNVIDSGVAVLNMHAYLGHHIFKEF